MDRLSTALLLLVIPTCRIISFTDPPEILLRKGQGAHFLFWATQQQPLLFSAEKPHFCYKFFIPTSDQVIKQPVCRQWMLGSRSRAREFWWWILRNHGISSWVKPKSWTAQLVTIYDVQSNLWFHFLFQISVYLCSVFCYGYLAEDSVCSFC